MSNFVSDILRQLETQHFLSKEDCEFIKNKTTFHLYRSLGSELIDNVTDLLPFWEQMFLECSERHTSVFWKLFVYVLKSELSQPGNEHYIPVRNHIKEKFGLIAQRIVIEQKRK